MSSRLVIRVTDGYRSRVTGAGPREGVSCYFRRKTCRPNASTVHGPHGIDRATLFYSSVSAMGLCVGLDDRGIEVLCPTRATDFYFLYRVHIGFCALQASYPLGIGRSFIGIKRPEREAEDIHLGHRLRINGYVAALLRTFSRHRNNFALLCGNGKLTKNGVMKSEVLAVLIFTNVSEAYTASIFMV